MNKRQRSILIEVFTVLIVTAVAVVGMINFKDYVNRSEAVAAMEQLGQFVLQHKADTGRTPSESVFLTKAREVQGGVRLVGLKYRGLWLGPDADPNDTLAYAEKTYPSSMLDDGYVVLQLDGTVHWVPKTEFEKRLARQRSDVEIEMTKP